MIAPINTTWTPERTERLKVLAAEGRTAVEIGSEFHISRNAVIGKIARMGFPWTGSIYRNHHGRRGKVVANPKRKAPGKFFSFNRPSKALPVTGAARTDVLQPVAATVSAGSRPKPKRKPCTLVKLRENSCRFPLGDHVPGHKDFRFCNDHAVEGYPYCEHHCRIAYQPIRHRERDAA